MWDSGTTPLGAIAIDGVLQGGEGKYELMTSGTSQTLRIKSVSLADDDVYRCYTLFDTEYDMHTLTVISKLDNTNTNKILCHKLQVQNIQSEKINCLQIMNSIIKLTGSRPNSET